MKIHLESESHLSCVRIVHKSVAVIVSKLEPIHCHLCTAKDSPVNFRYRIALNKHLTLDHAVPSDMLTQYSSQTYSCTYCDFSTLSNWSFTHHRFSCQAAPSDETRYRCLICNLGFCTKAEVTKHRSTQEHRDVATKKRGSYGATVRLRSCPHCYKQFTDLASLKNHFMSDHPDLLPRCIRCGTTFALKQQLSAHRFEWCLFWVVFINRYFVKNKKKTVSDEPVAKRRNRRNPWPWVAFLVPINVALKLSFCITRLSSILNNQVC